MNHYQSQYWQELYDFKVHVTYLEIYLLKTEKIDTQINSYLAVASSASIATWAIWQTYQLLWAGIIVVSQFITAIKPYLPYTNRIKSLSKIIKEMELLVIKYEKDWFYVSEGHKTEEEINELRFKLKEEKSKIHRKYFTKSILPSNEKYLEEAEDLTLSYFNNYHT